MRADVARSVSTFAERFVLANHTPLTFLFFLCSIILGQLESMLTDTTPTSPATTRRLALVAEAQAAQPLIRQCRRQERKLNARSRSWRAISEM